MRGCKPSQDGHHIPMLLASRVAIVSEASVIGEHPSSENNGNPVCTLLCCLQLGCLACRTMGKAALVCMHHVVGRGCLGKLLYSGLSAPPQLMGETKVVCGGYVVWCALSSIPLGSGRKLARSKLFCHGKHAACTQLVRCISLDCGAAAVSILFEECGHGEVRGCRQG